jgi:uncharacterized phage-associated protein
MATAHDVAAALVERLGGMTAMKLEKLVYYCQCWHLTTYGAPLFNEPIEAWRQGPVVPALYRRHRGRRVVTAWPDGDTSALDDDARASIEWVAENYGEFSAVQLSRMTHNELPWRAARGGVPDGAPSSAEVSHELIQAYYGRQRADAETAVTLATASAALEGIEFDDEWQERLRDVATGVTSADDAVAAEIARLNGR